MDNDPQIAVVGATGMVGREVVSQLASRNYSAASLTLFASKRSEGEEVDFGEEVLPVEGLAERAFKGMKAVILATPADVSKSLAVEAQREGAWVVDLSGAYHASAEVPLWAPGFNDAILSSPFNGRVVTVASAMTQLAAFALEPLRRAFGLGEAHVTLMLGAATAGNPGQRTLEKQIADLMGGREPDITVFPHRLGFNVIPEVGAISEGTSAYERQLQVEVGRLLAAAGPLTSTLFWVPTFHGIVGSFSVRLGKPVPGGDVAALFKDAKGVHVLDTPDEHIYPMPMLVTGDTSVHVGRLRVAHERLQFVAAVDNVGLAARGAVEGALTLGKRG